MELSSTTSQNAWVRLEPFEQRHRPGLMAAGADASIWRHNPFGVAKLGYGAWFDWIRTEQSEGRWLPFAVMAPTGEIVGQSCYINPRPALSCVEIGGTWYAPRAQSTAINPAAKLLLLDGAFAAGAERVELKTDALNAQSRAAMLKLGCSFEGIMRKQARRADGSWRDNAWYSMIAEDWPDIRERIVARLTTT